MEQLLKYRLEDAAFYHTDVDVCIKSNIYHVDVKKDDLDNIVALDIELENGGLCVNRHSKLKKLQNPPGSVLDFEWCFSIRNQLGLKIGYIGKLKTV